MYTVCITYLIIINVCTFIVWGRDKRKATTKKRRISEKQLLWLTMLGGGGGALLGQHFFRHKTIKGNFLRKFYLVIAVWGIVMITYLFR